MITGTVRRGVENYDARFAWVLEIHGLPMAMECGELRWEQFVSGGFTLQYSDGTSKNISAVSTMQKINPKTRQFGQWVDDVLNDMTPGPRKIESYEFASCRSGILRPAARLSDPRISYRFEDAPGFDYDFGDNVGGKTFAGIGWQLGFQHKLWRAGGKSPLFSRTFTLTGRYNQGGPDQRRIV